MTRAMQCVRSTPSNGGTLNGELASNTPNLSTLPVSAQLCRRISPAIFPDDVRLKFLSRESNPFGGSNGGENAEEVGATGERISLELDTWPKWVPLSDVDGPRFSCS